MDNNAPSPKFYDDTVEVLIQSAENEAVGHSKKRKFFHDNDTVVKAKSRKISSPLEQIYDAFENNNLNQLLAVIKTHFNIAPETSSPLAHHQQSKNPGAHQDSKTSTKPFFSNSSLKSVKDQKFQDVFLCINEFFNHLKNQICEEKQINFEHTGIFFITLLKILNPQNAYLNQLILNQQLEQVILYLPLYELEAFLDHLISPFRINCAQETAITIANHLLARAKNQPAQEKEIISLVKKLLDKAIEHHQHHPHVLTNLTNYIKEHSFEKFTLPAGASSLNASMK